MAAATTPKAATAESPADPVVADAEAAEAAVPLIEREFEVVRGFATYVKTQLLRYEKGDIIPSHPGESLHATGAPVKPVA